MVYLELLLGFLRVGLFSFGGAYAAIPLIREVVLEYGWLTDEEISYMIAVSESTPGPIMVNLATFIGSQKGGILGAILATLAVVLPAFIIILLIMVLFRALMKNKYFNATLDGLKSCVIGVILAIGLYMIADNLFSLKSGFAFDWHTLVTFLILAAVMYLPKLIWKKKPSPILFIAISAVVGGVIFSL